MDSGMDLSVRATGREIIVSLPKYVSSLNRESVCVCVCVCVYEFFHMSTGALSLSLTLSHSLTLSVSTDSRKNIGRR
jgi:hypothetical protein